jgi:hypothetical protein
LTGRTSAQSLSIAIYDAQYTTYVTAGGYGMAPISRTTTAPFPISDQVDLVSDHVSSHAIASADLFAVSEQTYFTTADAEAVSQIRFCPLTNQRQTLNIQITAGLPYDEGLISLLDLTSNSQLWNFSWNALGSGNNIPWTRFLGAADFNVDTEFFASHQYELTMAAGSDARDDDEFVNIRLNGLEVIPEPSVILQLISEVSQSGPVKSRPLTATLQAALASIERGNSIAAANQLQAFQNKVSAQVAPSDPVLAQTVIQHAQAVIDALRCDGFARKSTR